jgi:hypothetical protein
LFKSAFAAGPRRDGGELDIAGSRSGFGSLAAVKQGKAIERIATLRQDGFPEHLFVHGFDFAGDVQSPRRCGR